MILLLVALLACGGDTEEQNVNTTENEATEKSHASTDAKKNPVTDKAAKQTVKTITKPTSDNASEDTKNQTVNNNENTIIIEE